MAVNYKTGRQVAKGVSAHTHNLLPNRALRHLDVNGLLFRSGVILLWLRNKRTGTALPSLAQIGVRGRRGKLKGETMRPGDHSHCRRLLNYTDI